MDDADRIARLEEGLNGVIQAIKTVKTKDDLQKALMLANTAAVYALRGEGAVKVGLVRSEERDARSLERLQLLVVRTLVCHALTSYHEGRSIDTEFGPGDACLWLQQYGREWHIRITPGKWINPPKEVEAPSELRAVD